MKFVPHVYEICDAIENEKDHLSRLPSYLIKFDRLYQLEKLYKYVEKIENGESLPKRIYIGRCKVKGCKFAKQVINTEIIDGWNIKKNYPQAIECPEHKRPVYFEPVNYKHKEGHKCDARCMNARGPNCECSCGGENHGSSYK